MASLLPGFEYDIFISYRQKDNKGEQWVTEFVNSLKTELGTSFKEDISIYFDENPHDGLLESHDVDASLAGKIKSLIFIPIISRTYCDTKSFAWQHEFLAFKEIASKDHFGLKVKLANGNVASRIHPIRIHDLDSEDKALLENELGGPLRGIEFIYKEPGVNRPLTQSDDENKNLNKTKYRNQINKVANAVKEIIGGLKNPNRSDIVDLPRSPSTNVEKRINKKAKITTTSIVVLTLLVLGYFLYPLLSGSSSEPIEKSIAVLAFENMSNDPDQEPLSDGLSEELITQLSKIKNLKVTGRTSSFSFKGKHEDLREIGRKLNVEAVLEGSVQKSGNNLRITAQLISTKDGTHIWADRFDRSEDDIFKIQDEISASVVEALKLSFLTEGNVTSARQTNLEAYKWYLKGRHYYFQSDPRAIKSFEEALAIDSLYAKAWAGIALHKISLEASMHYEVERKFAQRAFDIDPNEPDAIGALAFIDFVTKYNYAKTRREIQRGLQIDPNNYQLLTTLNQIDIVLENIEEAERISLKLVEIDPINPFTYVTRARTLWAQNKLTEAEKELESAYELSPKNEVIPFSLGLISLEKGNPKEALDRLVNKGTEDFIYCEVASSMAYFALGNKKESDEILQWAISKHSNTHPGVIANCYAFRNDKDHTFQWINKGMEVGDTPQFLIVNPHFFNDEFKSDPRYRELRKRINLPF